MDLFHKRCKSTTLVPVTWTHSSFDIPLFCDSCDYDANGYLKSSAPVSPDLRCRILPQRHLRNIEPHRAERADKARAFLGGAETTYTQKEKESVQLRDRSGNGHIQGPSADSRRCDYSV